MQTYRHSGAITSHGVLMVAAAGFATAVAAAFAYTFGIAYIPFIYINALLTIGFGALIGAIVGLTCKYGKVRNDLLITALAVKFAVVGVYCAWGVVPLSIVGLEAGISGFSPQVMVEWITFLYENGSWGMDDNSTVHGLPLAGIWLLETAMIIGFSVLAARSMVSHQPFCEDCDRWTATEKGVQLLAAHGEEPVWEIVKAGDLEAMNQLTLADNETNPVVRLNLSTCPTCSHSNFLTIERVEYSVDQYNNVKEDTKPIVRNLIIEQNQIELVRNLGMPNRMELPETEANAGADPASAVSAVTPSDEQPAFIPAETPL